MPTKKTIPEYPTNLVEISHNLANLGTILTEESKLAAKRKKVGEQSTDLAMSRISTLMAELAGKTMSRAFVVAVQSQVTEKVANSFGSTANRNLHNRILGNAEFSTIAKDGKGDPTAIRTALKEAGFTTFSQMRTYVEKVDQSEDERELVNAIMELLRTYRLDGDVSPLAALNDEQLEKLEEKFASPVRWACKIEAPTAEEQAAEQAKAALKQAQEIHKAAKSIANASRNRKAA